MTEARGKERGTPTVVNSWGEMNTSRSVLAASMDDRLNNPVQSFNLFNAYVSSASSLVEKLITFCLLLLIAAFGCGEKRWQRMC